jgi:hypothetical protein
MDLDKWLAEATGAVRTWAAEFGAYATHPSLEVSDAAFAPMFAEFTERLRDNYPFFHPRYVGHTPCPRTAPAGSISKRWRSCCARAASARSC